LGFEENDRSVIWKPSGGDGSKISINLTPSALVKMALFLGEAL
jgi:hypothetical protein